MSSAGVDESFTASAPFTEEFFATLMESEPGCIGGQQFKKTNFENLILNCLGVGALQVISLGGLLLQIRDKYYVGDDQKFGQYCYERLGLGTQEALRLIGVFFWARNTNLFSPQIANLGVPKLLLLAEKIAPEAMPQMFDSACNATYPELRKNLKVCAGQNEKKLKWTTKRFRLAADQSGNIEKAIQQCKLDAGTIHDSVALDLICTQYLTDPGFPTKERVRQYLKSIGPDATSDLVKSARPGDDFD